MSMFLYSNGHRSSVRSSLRTQLSAVTLLFGVGARGGLFCGRTRGRSPVSRVRRTLHACGAPFLTRDARFTRADVCSHIEARVFTGAVVSFTARCDVHSAPRGVDRCAGEFRNDESSSRRFFAVVMVVLRRTQLRADVR